MTMKMKKNKHIIQQYLKEILNKVNCSKSFKSVFKKQLTNDILQFTENKETITLEELYIEFGFPEEIADSFIDRSDYKTLLEKSKKKLLYWKIIFSFSLILAIAATIFGIYVLNDFMDFTVTISDIY